MLFRSLLVAVGIAFTGPLVSLLIGMAAGLVAGGFSALLLIYGGLWIHPGLPAGITAALTLVSILSALVWRHWNRDILNRAYGFRVPVGLLRYHAWAGQVQTSGVSQAKAVILGIRYIHPGEQKRPEEDTGQAETLKTFQDEAARKILLSGGVVIGTDGFIVLGVFGSPLETKIPHKGKTLESDPAKEFQALASRACAATLEIMGPETAADNFWRFGLDIGECAFFHTEAGGYTAVGRPPVYARILSGLALKYSCRILITQELNDAVGEQWLTRRLDTLVAKSSGKEEAFYELSGQPWH